MLKLKTIKNYALAFSVLALVSCSSSGPATSYYSFFPSKVTAAQVGEKRSKSSLGVALVTLPGYLQSSAIVSRTNGQRINVSGYHAWAEPLDEAVTRTLAGDLRQLLNVERVVGFPWDMRQRPELQLKVNIEQLDGVRGSEVNIAATWTLYDVKSKRTVSSGEYSHTLETENKSYEAYVKSLNDLLGLLSNSIAATVKKAS